MKKVLVLLAVLVTSFCIVLTSCDDPETASAVADAIGAGADGWSFVGYADSVSECKTMVLDDGYTQWRLNTGLGACYGR